MSTAVRGGKSMYSVCVHVLNGAVELSSVVACFRLFLRRGVWRAVLALSERVASHGS